MATGGKILGEQRSCPSTRRWPGTHLWFSVETFWVTICGLWKDYTSEGVDQLRECIKKIKENPTDRRIILSAWNPKGTFSIIIYSQINKHFLNMPLMALPPSHLLCQFYVQLPPASNPSQKLKLSSFMYQRSTDLGLGIPFSIAPFWSPMLLARMRMSWLSDLAMHMCITTTSTRPKSNWNGDGNRSPSCKGLETISAWKLRTLVSILISLWKVSRLTPLFSWR